MFVEAGQQVAEASQHIHLAKMPLGQIASAIGGLGTAAFGVVDASKAVIPGINRIGMKHIRGVVVSLTPDPTGEGVAAGPMNSLPRRNVLEAVEANWINGNDVASQKQIAKSLIKLHMCPGNAAAMAAKTYVDPVILKSIATKISTGDSLTQAEVDVYARFDLIVTALLDEAYQRSDQKYRNTARGLAALVAVLLAVAAGWALTGEGFWTSQALGLSVLAGLLATPLAPVAKDLSSGLAAAVNSMQLVKRD